MTTLATLLALVPTNNLRQITAVSLQTLLNDLLHSATAGVLTNDGADNLSWQPSGSGSVNSVADDGNGTMNVNTVAGNVTIGVNRTRIPAPGTSLDLLYNSAGNVTAATGLRTSSGNDLFATGNIQVGSTITGLADLSISTFSSLDGGNITTDGAGNASISGNVSCANVLPASGFTGSGVFTTFTIVNGIVTAAA